MAKIHTKRKTIKIKTGAETFHQIKDVLHDQLQLLIHSSKGDVFPHKKK